MLDIFVDADACPVKNEVYRVAQRYGLHVRLITNLPLRAPEADWIELVTVDDKYDAADNWIVEHVRPDDIVITGDIRLADRCLKKEALVLGTSGRPFTPNNIGSALASREILSHLRSIDDIPRGPAPLQKKDRSRFLQQLDEMIQRVKRGQPADDLI